MFEQSIVTPTSTSKPWSFALSLTLQAAGVTGLILLPLVYTEQLSQALMRSSIFVPGRPSPPQQQVTRAASAQRSTTQVRPTPHPLAVFLKTHTPRPITEIIFIDDAPVCSNCSAVQTMAGNGPYMPGAGFIGDSTSNIVPPPPPPQPQAQEIKPKTPQVVRVGGGVMAAKIVRRIVPTYPPLARQARVSGTVKLMGKIAKDGTIQELQVISGHPLLARAALDAVRQWVYKPTLLNGEPVEVLAPIEVNFNLSQ